MRCAIYTRKSADERAGGQLSTIENQRNLCVKYIESQAGESWTVLAKHYDDLSYSGGNLNRPALRRLLADVEAGQVDVVVVYKIDRLSRSLRDFVRLVDQFERHGVSFVAITQSFDTRSSMGRLTLNVLLSFAQFEREITSERLKDWFAAARARGLWHGPEPYGYKVNRGVLSVNNEQAAVVRQIFCRYPILGSAKEVAKEITRAGALNTWSRPFNGWHVMRILRNRLYLGELPHRGEFLPGRHPPIVSERTWDRAHRAIALMSRKRRPKFHLPPEAPLYPLLHDRNGAAMVHLHYERRGRIYRYYVPSRRRYGPDTSPDDRYRAVELEDSILAVLDRIGCTIVRDDRPGWLTGALRRLIARIDLIDDRTVITLQTGAVFETPTAGRVARTVRTALAP